MPTIGTLVVGSPASERFWRLFQQDMRELGYIEGRNVRYEFRSDMGEASRLPALAEELVRLKVGLIVAWFTPAALAAKQATHQIPIVMALVGNPVETELVASLAQPGGNVTGMAAIGAELAGKLVDVVHDLIAHPVLKDLSDSVWLALCLTTPHHRPYPEGGRRPTDCAEGGRPEH